MLGSIFTIAVVVSCVAGQYDQSSSHQSGYGPQYYSTRNVYAELAEAKSRVRNLKGNDKIINNRLEDLRQKVVAVSEFRKTFEANTLPAIQGSMATQDAQIEKINDDLKDLSPLFNQVEELTTKVNNLLDDLKEIRETRKQILESISDRQNEQIDQNRLISNLEAQITLQDEQLADVEDNRIKPNEANTDILKGKVASVVDVVNREKAETVVIELTKDHPEATYEFENSYDVAPKAVWTIVGFHATDIKEYYELESIYASVELVSVDTNSATIKLKDQSVGFEFDSVKVSVTIFIVDNDEIEH